MAAVLRRFCHVVTRQRIGTFCPPARVPQRVNATFNHGFTYWIYGVMSVLAALFVLRFVPETKERSLESIQNIWTKAPVA